MIEILIAGFALADANIDVLLAARDQIDQTIQDRAAEELALIEERKAALLKIICQEPDAETPDEKPSHRQPKNPPKYYNKSNPDQTWTGRGKAPAWFEAEGRCVSVEIDPAFAPCCAGDCGNDDSEELLHEEEPQAELI